MAQTIHVFNRLMYSSIAIRVLCTMGYCQSPRLKCRRHEYVQLASDGQVHGRYLVRHRWFPTCETSVFLLAEIRTKLKYIKNYDRSSDAFAVAILVGLASEVDIETIFHNLSRRAVVRYLRLLFFSFLFTIKTLQHRQRRRKAKK